MISCSSFWKAEVTVFEVTYFFVSWNNGRVVTSSEELAGYADRINLPAHGKDT